MDSSIISSLYLLPDWLNRLMEDYEDEVARDGSNGWCVQLLPDGGRKAVWSMSSLLGAERLGIPGQACRLLERYLSTHLRDSVRSFVDDDDWVNFKRALALRVPLLIASCVQLAAKMSCAGLLGNPKMVRACLGTRGVVCTVNQIIAAEFQVFSTLGYHVPIWTSVETAQLLGMRVGLSMTVVEGLEQVVNIAEFRRVLLSERVQAIANVTPPPAEADFSTQTLRTLHLAAGCVVAGARFFGRGDTGAGAGRITGDALAPMLAELTHAPHCYIQCISDVILTEILNDNEPQPHSKKRKLNSYNS